MKQGKAGIATMAIHAGSARDVETGAISPPVHLSTTFAHPADASQHQGYLYQRYRDPTGERLEAALSAVEGAAGALHFATGMAAGTALMQALPQGGHVLLADDTYFAFRQVAAQEFARWGLSYSLVDMTDLAAVTAALTPNTCCLWLETPSNPLLKISDVSALAQLAQEHQALCVVDATFASPLCQQTLALGADVVLHSSTKYLGGHSDVMGGALVFAQRSALFERCFELRKLLGASAAPFNSWLVLRGLKTLPCRMQWHTRNAMRIAAWLEAHAQVAAVFYPGLPSHPQHQLACRQMTQFGGMLSFLVRGGRAAALAAAERLQLIQNATSLGAVESLIEHRESVEGPGSPTPANLLRLSVGLEDCEDLMADLAQALDG